MGRPDDAAKDRHRSRRHRRSKASSRGDDRRDRAEEDVTTNYGGNDKRRDRKNASSSGANDDSGSGSSGSTSSSDSVSSIGAGPWTDSDDSHDNDDGMGFGAPPLSSSDDGDDDSRSSSSSSTSESEREAALGLIDDVTAELKSLSKRGNTAKGKPKARDPFGFASIVAPQGKSATAKNKGRKRMGDVGGKADIDLRLPWDQSGARSKKTATRTDATPGANGKRTEKRLKRQARRAARREAKRIKKEKKRDTLSVCGDPSALSQRQQLHQQPLPVAAVLPQYAEGTLHGSHCGCPHHPSTESMAPMHATPLLQPPPLPPARGKRRPNHTHEYSQYTETVYATRKGRDGKRRGHEPKTSGHQRTIQSHTVVYPNAQKVKHTTCTVNRLGDAAPLPCCHHHHHHHHQEQASMPSVHDRTRDAYSDTTRTARVPCANALCCHRAPDHHRAFHRDDPTVQQSGTATVGEDSNMPGRGDYGAFHMAYHGNHTNCGDIHAINDNDNDDDDDDDSHFDLESLGQALTEQDQPWTARDDNSANSARNPCHAQQQHAGAHPLGSVTAAPAAERGTMQQKSAQTRTIAITAHGITLDAWVQRVRNEFDEARRALAPIAGGHPWHRAYRAWIKGWRALIRRCSGAVTVAYGNLTATTADAVGPPRTVTSAIRWGGSLREDMARMGASRIQGAAAMHALLATATEEQRGQEAWRQLHDFGASYSATTQQLNAWLEALQTDGIATVTLAS